MVPGQGFIVVGNKTQKNTICIFIEKQNRMSDTRGETIRHNMQKNTCIFVKHVKN
jgi:phosphoribosylformylglycinamidine (FGAM) synthase PurS component